jgi:hypothetical protein
LIVEAIFQTWRAAAIRKAEVLKRINQRIDQTCQVFKTWQVSLTVGENGTDYFLGLLINEG